MDNMYVFDETVIDAQKVEADAYQRTQRGGDVMVHYHGHGKPCNEKCHKPTLATGEAPDRW